ncbi:MAG: aminotransferase class IV [Flavobacteriaceae bacterium]|nr:aminotransferase class IV [Flavobacteriaceae bacterium]|tara:strand:+ start:551 stop:1393 length:843 start_codon:yes stop_codon:yes gene_type:complete
MININGTLLEDAKANLSLENRGFNYGDAIFETIKVNNRPLFWEAHYFRLMASMRIMRMKIPMKFTPEFLEAEIMDLIATKISKVKSHRVKLSVYRVSGGYYTPDNNSIEYSISTSPLDNFLYTHNPGNYEIDLFKNYQVSPNLLSTIKTNNKALNVIGSIYAKENNFNNCLLLNTNKHVIEALNGNIFLVKNNIIKTPPLLDGCMKGIIRGKLIEIINKNSNYELNEKSISPFELQKADEIFITNVISGIIPITKFRKKEYKSQTSKLLLEKLNIKIRLV